MPVGVNAAGVRLVLSCQKCRDLIVEFGFTKGQVRPGQLLVLQTVDVETGDVLPSETRVILDYDRESRSGNRGGSMLDPNILSDALARYREAMARKREDKTR